jgi:drug/metabolite transporter (DMT)-like permease
VILGFPLLTAWAMARVPASHGAVILGLLPLATAAAAALRAAERPSRAFWLASSAGSAVVIAFALQNGVGGLEAADLALLGAVAAAAMGYAEGGRLSRHLGGLEVISWALVLSVPVVALLGGRAVLAISAGQPLTAWLAFGYVSVVSQFLGFAAWYRGLALGGVARVGQLQLLQPFFTILGSALLLREAVSFSTIGAALLVVLMVAIGRKAPVESRPLNENA